MKKIISVLIITVILTGTFSRSFAQCPPTSAHATLLAGQFINAGGVIVTNDGVNLTVTYYTNTAWKLKEVQLYVGSYANMPVNGGGNPKVGNFPYRQNFPPNSTTLEYTKVISLSGLPECFVVAAHAVVQNRCNSLVTETGWADGQQFPGGNWGTYINYCKTTCP